MKNDQQERFNAALRRASKKHSVITVDMNWITLVSMVASVQLALRHPGNNGGTAERMTAFGRRILSIIEDIEPDLAEALEIGFHPEHDVHPNT